MGRSPGAIKVVTPYAIRLSSDQARTIRIPVHMMDAISKIVRKEPADAQRDRPRAHARGACREARHAAREEIEAPRERAPAKVINLMDALRRSVEAERGGGERRKTERRGAADHRAPKKAGRSPRQKKAG